MIDVTKPEGLMCDHCGGTAIEFKPPAHHSDFWHLFDGDGGCCAECSWPGSVSVGGGNEEEEQAYWLTNDWDDGLMCSRIDCEECRT